MKHFMGAKQVKKTMQKQSEVFNIAVSTCVKSLGQSNIIHFMLHLPFRTYIQISAQTLERGLQNYVLKGRQCKMVIMPVA